MEVINFPIAGLKLIKPRVFGDDRGHFLELFKQSALEEALPGVRFMQDNLSFSKKGTIRGLHFQKAPHAQGKLVTVIKGKVLDVAVDLRPGSETYGEVQKVVLDDQEKALFYVPEGFAHGFCAYEDTHFLYKCTAEYNKDSEGGIVYNDPTLGIDWGTEAPIVSEKDLKLPYFA